MKHNDFVIATIRWNCYCCKPTVPLNWLIWWGNCAVCLRAFLPTKVWLMLTGAVDRRYRNGKSLTLCRKLKLTSDYARVRHAPATAEALTCRTSLFFRLLADKNWDDVVSGFFLWCRPTTKHLPFSTFFLASANCLVRTLQPRQLPSYHLPICCLLSFNNSITSICCNRYSEKEERHTHSPVVAYRRRSQLLDAVAFRQATVSPLLSHWII